jgi:hypothetical protein
LLAKQVHRGYTEVPAFSAVGEPEAVTASEQQWLTAESHARHDGEVRAVVLRMQSDLAILRAQRDRRFRSELRSIQLALEGIRRCL